MRNYYVQDKTSTREIPVTGLSNAIKLCKGGMKFYHITTWSEKYKRWIYVTQYRNTLYFKFDNGKIVAKRLMN